MDKGWFKRFFRDANLERSFRELDGCHDFFDEVMRGRIRSLQLRFDEAWTHFDRASELADTVEETEKNLARQVVFEIYRFDNALVEDRVDPETEVPTLQLPLPPAQVRHFLQHKSFKYALDQRKLCEAILHLHVGHCEEAAAIFERLIQESPKFRPDQYAGYYLGLAACEDARGRSSETQKNLENASNSTHMVEHALPAATLVSLLIGMHKFLDNHEAVETWQTYLRVHVRCPQATKRVFVKHAERLWNRCLEHNRLLVF